MLTVVPGRPRIYPVGLLLEGQPCLVVGGGEIAARKAARLLAGGADVTVIAPEVDLELSGVGVTIERRRYRPGDAAGFRLVVAATGDREVDAAVFADGEALGIFVNSADDPDNCSMFLPAIFRRGRVTVSVSTDGSSPALASWLRDEIAKDFSEGTETLAETLEIVRTEIRASGRSTLSLGWRALIDTLDRAVRAGESGEDLLARGREWMNSEFERVNLQPAPAAKR